MIDDEAPRHLVHGDAPPLPDIDPLAFSVGVAEAYREGPIDPLRLLLGLVGVLLAHISVNVINDYFDYVSGLDLKGEENALQWGERHPTPGPPRA